MKYIVGNWKMNLGIRESVALARGVLRELRGEDEAPEVVLCPPFTALSEVRKVLARSRVRLGAQNCGTERSGAFTGEVSVAMLEDVSCSFVTVGHSERRTIFNETDDIVRKKLSVAMESKLTPILCVGESKEERDADRAKEFVQGQLAASLDGLNIPRSKPVFVAYEPVWAIGSGNPATVAEIIDMHQFIRNEVLRLTNKDEEGVAVLYGGSVDEENAYQYLREREVDGLLVGGASLKLQAFGGILRAGIDVIVAQQ